MPRDDRFNDEDDSVESPEPDESDSEAVMRYEQERYAPILVELEELESTLTRAEDETEAKQKQEAQPFDERDEDADEDDFLL